MKSFLPACCFILLSCWACQHEQQREITRPDSLKEHLITLNKKMVEKESHDITDFINRHHWQMASTGTGLRYDIYVHGKGKQAEKNRSVAIAYKLYLLNGELCYESDENKPLVFTPERAEQPRGLEEGVLMMHEGDQARFVLPAHLGYGLTGDGNKIPGSSPLYYDVTLLKTDSLKK